MKQNSAVRMADIAQQLRISPSTVSRALRGDARISARTRAQIVDLAQRLEYRPNPMVSALMATRNQRKRRDEIDCLALITSYGEQDDWTRKEVCCWEFDGLRARAESLGYRIEVFPLREYGGECERLQETLRVRGIRGIILGFSRETGDLELALDRHFAVAGLSAYFRENDVDRANFHGFFNVQLALEEMWALGYRRPALAVPDLNNRISNNHWSGAFLDWQRRFPPRSRCEPFIPDEAEDSVAFKDWLRRENPDSLLVYKVPVRRLLAKLNLRVPEDLGVAYLYRTADEMGNAAGIDGNLWAVGAATVDLVVEQLHSNLLASSRLPKEVLIKGTWHPGATLVQHQS